MFAYNPAANDADPHRAHSHRKHPSSLSHADPLFPAGRAGLTSAVFATASEAIPPVAEPHNILHSTTTIPLLCHAPELNAPSNMLAKQSVQHEYRHHRNGESRKEWPVIGRKPSLEAENAHRDRLTTRRLQKDNGQLSFVP